MSTARHPLLAELFEVIETQTPYGGRSTTHEPVGSAWLRLGARQRRERTEASRATVVETVVAESRADARLVAGRLLRFGGGDWRVVAADAVGGRAILKLERIR